MSGVAVDFLQVPGYSCCASTHSGFGFCSPEAKADAATQAVFLRPSHGTPSFGQAVLGGGNLCRSLARSANLTRACPPVLQRGGKQSKRLLRSTP